MAKNIKPLSNYVLIKPLKNETTTPSGIVIPDSAKEKPQEGEIVAVGPGKKDETGNTVKMSVNKGDVVIYKNWGGKEIKIDGEDHILLKEDDLLAIVN